MRYKIINCNCFYPFFLRKIYIVTLVFKHGRNKMRKTILFGSLLSIFLMFMVPNVGAVEYQNTVDAGVALFESDFDDLEKMKTQLNTIRNQLDEIAPKNLIRKIQAINQIEAGSFLKTEFDILDLSNDHVDAVKELLNSDLFSEVLIKGILIPIIIILLVESISLTFDLPVFLSSLTGIFLGFFFLGPVALRVSDETAIPYSIIFPLLLIIDVVIPYSILGLIFS